MIVRPVSRAAAKRMCQDHPHAGTLPNSSKYYMVAYNKGKPLGLAVWGYGILPQATPKKMFGKQGNLGDYLELCRFFVYDDVPKNTASEFLAITHKIIKKYDKNIKWLYTYAAGFQGLIGTIYQAANYDYIGRKLCNAFLYIPDVGLIHAIAQWHRYGKSGLKNLSGIYKDAKEWKGYNFAYIYWLCSSKEKVQLMKTASFEIVDKYPTKADLEIWLEDKDGNKEILTEKFAKSIPIVKLPTKRKGLK